MEILLEGRGLTRRFQKKGQTIEAVHEVSFTLQKGTALGIVGASGSGKSTLARMAAGCHRKSACAEAGDPCLR